MRFDILQSNKRGAGVCRVSLLDDKCHVRARAGCHLKERSNMRLEFAHRQYHPRAFCIYDLCVVQFDLVAVIAYWLARSFVSVNIRSAGDHLIALY